MTPEALAAERQASRERQMRRVAAGERPVQGVKVRLGFKDFQVGGWRKEETEEAWAYLPPREER